MTQPSCERRSRSDHRTSGSSSTIRIVTLAIQSSSPEGSHRGYPPSYGIAARHLLIDDGPRSTSQPGQEVLLGAIAWSLRNSDATTEADFGDANGASACGRLRNISAGRKESPRARHLPRCGPHHPSAIGVVLRDRRSAPIGVVLAGTDGAPAGDGPGSTARAAPSYSSAHRTMSCSAK